jgi:hypothetical protein
VLGTGCLCTGGAGTSSCADCRQQAADSRQAAGRQQAAGIRHVDGAEAAGREAYRRSSIVNHISICHRPQHTTDNLSF